ncbi:MAG TPA: hypothetical protein VFU01_19430 [Gemmatimonadaceae bacterium]|nr:hypothetical protein [Gemmatimonadaceae bacterium]
MGVLRRKRQSDPGQPNRPARAASALSDVAFQQLSDQRISETPVPARVIETPNGQRWLVVLIAKLASIDPTGEARGARLIVRVEPLFGGHDRARILTVRAGSLDEMDGEALRDALLRRRGGDTPRKRRKVDK